MSSWRQYGRLKGKRGRGKPFPKKPRPNGVNFMKFLIPTLFQIKNPSLNIIE
jgi:hypothetical protein